ncbi:MAG: T9SS type A sorting domain-containing protein [Bacteroidia bacterium]|nr:T9SS type A sorting domain-containing protein [Bacteroidia bacterium]
MKILYFSLLLFLISVFSFSQNYLTVKPNSNSYYFGQNNETVFPIRIDSIKTHGDSTDYYSFCMIRTIENYNFTKNGASWIGKKMTDCGNGINLFFNYENDTIHIKTNALINDSWRFYTYSNGSYINATISNHNSEAFLGLIDSIKTISFQVKDAAGNNITDNINNYQLKLSKNYGFIKIFNFYDFPFNPGSADFFYVSSPVMDLIGLSNPTIGWQNFTLSDVFSMNTSDEIHLSVNYYDALNGTGTMNNFNEKYINKYIGRVENANHDTVKFTIDRCFWRIEKYNQNILQIMTSRDTVIENFALTGEFNKLPLEPIFDEGFYGYYYKHDSTGYRSTLFFQEINDTLYPLQIDGWNYIYYKNSLGKTFASDGFMNITYGSNYSYYYVHGISWGQPYICDSLLADTILGLNIINSFVEIKFYPNPASNYIEIIKNNNNLQNTTVEILDIQGKVIKAEDINTNFENINISEIPAGVYIIRITNQKICSNHKLIITR